MEITKVDNQYIIINKSITHIFKKALENGNMKIVNEIYESNKDCIDKYIKNRLNWSKSYWCYNSSYLRNLDSMVWIFDYIDKSDIVEKLKVKKAIFKAYFKNIIVKLLFPNLTVQMKYHILT